MTTTGAASAVTATPRETPPLLKPPRCYRVSCCRRLKPPLRVLLVYLCARAGSTAESAATRGTAAVGTPR